MSTETYAHTQMFGIIYMHGLGGRPGGVKHTLLASIYGQHCVKCPEMDLDIGNWYKVPAFCVLMAMAIATVCAVGFAAIKQTGTSAAFATVAILATALATIPLYRAGIRWAIDRAVAVQAAAVLRHAPSLVIGTSLGGAIAIELMRRGIWTKKTILLAPASAWISAHTGIPESEWAPRPRSLPSSMQINIVHGTNDELVPYTDSIRLSELLRAAGANVRLELVPGDNHHLAGSTTRKNMVGWITSTQ